MCVSAGRARHRWNNTRREGERLIDSSATENHPDWSVLFQGDPGQYGDPGQKGEQGPRGEPGTRGSMVGMPRIQKSFCVELFCSPESYSCWIFCVDFQSVVVQYFLIVHLFAAIAHRDWRETEALMGTGAIQVQQDFLVLLETLDYLDKVTAGRHLAVVCVPSRGWFL